MSEQITQVTISIGFGRRKKSLDTYAPRVYKKGEGRNLYEAIKNLFNRPYNYITQDQMTVVRKEVMVTKEKMFKRKD